MKNIRFFASVGLLLGALFLAGSVQGQEAVAPTLYMESSPAASEQVVIHMFTRDDCSFCLKQTEFLEALAQTRSDFIVEYHNLADLTDRDLFVRFTDARSLPKVTPLTVIGRSIVQGFDSPEGAGARISFAIDRALVDGPISLDVVMASEDGEVVGSVESGCEGEVCDVTAGPSGFIFKLPFFGVVDLQKFSLFTLAGVLGFVDGFNPCAMWVLVTFLLVLMQIGDRKKMFQVAGLFILAEGVMYTFILNVWYNTWDFVGLDKIVTPLVGILALGGGIFFLYRWRKQRNAGLVCDVTDIDQQTKIETKIHKFASAPMSLAIAFGVIGLALSVNIIEFACSIGIPQAFTKILELNALGFWKTQVYMAVYTMAYMIDDLIVFGIALYGFDRLHHHGQKYSRLSLLIGGVLMVILGALLIWDPSILMF